MIHIDALVMVAGGAAMRLALDCGVAINAAYRFLTPNERPSNGY